MSSLGMPGTGGIRQYSFFRKKVVKPVAVSNLFDALSTPDSNKVATTPVDPMTPTVFDKILWKTSHSQNHGKSKSKVVVGKHDKYLYKGRTFSLDKFARLNSSFISSQVSLGRLPTSRLMREDDPKLTDQTGVPSNSCSGSLPISLPIDAITCDATILSDATISSTIDFPLLAQVPRARVSTVLSSSISASQSSRSSASIASTKPAKPAAIASAPAKPAKPAESTINHDNDNNNNEHGKSEASGEHEQIQNIPVLHNHDVVSHNHGIACDEHNDDEDDVHDAITSIHAALGAPFAKAGELPILTPHAALKIAALSTAPCKLSPACSKSAAVVYVTRGEPDPILDLGAQLRPSRATDVSPLCEAVAPASSNTVVKGNGGTSTVVTLGLAKTCLEATPSTILISPGLASTSTLTSQATIPVPAAVPCVRLSLASSCPAGPADAPLDWSSAATVGTSEERLLSSSCAGAWSGPIRCLAWNGHVFDETIPDAIIEKDDVVIDDPDFIEMLDAEPSEFEDYDSEVEIANDHNSDFDSDVEMEEVIDNVRKINRREQLMPSTVESAALTVARALCHQRSHVPCESREVPPPTDEPGIGETHITGDARSASAPGHGLLKPVGGGMNTFIYFKKPNPISAVQPSADDWIEIEVTVDSGACETVMPASMAQGIQIVQSVLSHGAEYEVANGQTIPNLGERRCLLMTLGSATAKKIVFQVADVHKPLLSISRCADMGFYTFLGKDGGYMEDMVTGEQIPLQRQDNLYTMRAWIRRDPGNGPPNINQPFAGPV